MSSLDRLRAAAVRYAAAASDPRMAPHEIVRVAQALERAAREYAIDHVQPPPPEEPSHAAGSSAPVRPSYEDLVALVGQAAGWVEQYAPTEGVARDVARGWGDLQKDLYAAWEAAGGPALEERRRADDRARKEARA